MVDNVEVPPFFVCPISLEIMKDPVTLSTGITYDRESIEKWMFSQRNQTCPVTKQDVTGSIDLTPNSTLRRLIQSWCTLNASYGVERHPTPKPPVVKSDIVKLLNDTKNTEMQMKCLKRLKEITMESEANRRLMEATGAADFLALIINNSSCGNVASSSSEHEVSYDAFELTTASDEAISILHHLQLSKSGLKAMFNKNGDAFIESLSRIMQHGNYESRTYVVLLLNSIFEVADPMQIMSLKMHFFADLVQIMHEHVSQKATKATLKLLLEVCPWGRNRIKAVEAGAVSELVDMLLDSSEKRVCEMVLTLLDQLCQCAEGRSELLRHGAGLAVVSKKIFRVSGVATDRAVKILLSVARYSASSLIVVQDMLQLGVVAKLCLVLQVDCKSKTKEKAMEILKLHARAWKNSPCIPVNLLNSYPS